MMTAATSKFLQAKAATLAARSTRLTRLTPALVGITRGYRDYAPSAQHFAAANQRLAGIERLIRKRLGFMAKRAAGADSNELLVNLAMVEREVDRARRTFGMFFEIFSQRGSAFAPALSAHDAIAVDCYAAVRRHAPQLFGGPVLKPLTYMEHGYSPATQRRGVTLARLLGERNPFPLIRIPWDRDNPWQATFIHEVAHNLQADMRLWEENKQAVTRRLIRSVGDPFVITTYSRWHKEIFADLCALLLGGPATVWGMMDFLAHPAPRTLTYKPGGAHPTGYFRVLLLAEMLKRMGFDSEAARVRKTWTRLYRPQQGHRLPGRLLQTAAGTIPHVVDEIAFQTRRNLAQRALVDVIRFTPRDEQRIRAAAGALTRGKVPADLPPRFLVSASRHALLQGAPPQPLSALVIGHLAARSAKQRTTPVIPTQAAA